MIISIKNQLTISLMLIGMVLLTLVAYWPGLGGPFLLDDFHNLKPLNDHGGVHSLEAFLHFVFGNESGRLGRPVSMMSFLINDQYWPGSPSFYKYVNLLIHTIVGVLVFAFARVLLRSHSNYNVASIMALAIAAIWLLHPLNVSTTLYIVQRMTQLSAIFTLAGLMCFLAGRRFIIRKPIVGFVALTLGVGGFGALAVLSKENGLLLVVYIAVIELTIFAHYKRSVLFWYWLFIFVILPIMAFVLYIGLSWEAFQSAYSKREFSPYERLLTEARILCLYLKDILLPTISGMGLFHDNIEVSRSIISPVSTAISCAVVVILNFAAIFMRKSQPVLAFAILWYFGGHLMESTIIPLELYFEHRNYLPMVGPLIGFVYYCVVGLSAQSSFVVRMVCRAAPVVLIVIFLPMTAYSATVWGNPLRLFAVMEVENRGSLRAKRALAYELERHGQIQQAAKVGKQALERHPYDLSMPLYLMALQCDHSIDAGASAETIHDRIGGAKITDGLVANLDRLNVLVSNNMCPNVIDREKLSAIFYDVEGIQGFHAHKKMAARIYFEHANLEVSRRQLSSSMELLDYAYRLQPTVDIALRQTVILASAGLYTQALETLAKAREADSRRGILSPSRERELEFVERSIQANMER